MSEKSIHKQKKSMGNNMLVSAKYRMMVFFLLFLALKDTWKTKGQTMRGLKDSHSIAQTKKRSTTPKKGEGTKQEHKRVPKCILYLPKFNSGSTKVY